MNGARATRHRALLLSSTALTLSFVLLLSLFIASHLTRSSHRHHATYSGDFTRIEVTVNGAATVAGSARSSVRAEWDLSWSLSRPRVEARAEGGALRLSVSCPGMPGRGCSSSTVLSVPAHARVQVSADEGVRVRGVRGGLSARTRGGDVALDDVRGHVEARTREGRIEATGLSGRTVEAASRDGSVRLAFARPPRTVDVATRDGHASLALPRVAGGYAVRTGGGTAAARVTAPTNPGSARSVTVRSRDTQIRVATTAPAN